MAHLAGSAEGSPETHVAASEAYRVALAAYHVEDSVAYLAEESQGIRVVGKEVEHWDLRSVEEDRDVELVEVEGRQIE